MCIISRLVRRCHCRRRVIIVSHVAIVITIVVVSRRNTAHRAVPIAVTVAVVVAIVVVVAHNDIAPSSSTSLPVALSPRVSQSLG